ncbi:hypothetical protein [Cyanobium sp. NIES-981]|uniref:hypothetical protein n=1 Tax=Cyanobium sp. NIES-981 TaxID=1851505 RepID=UPI0007DDF5C6|nr:hypothetical protein [Cyanobium sp. NIES-981]SBO44603.1 protein of unknown function [Cyanobium sp. NIES-981]
MNQQSCFVLGHHEAHCLEADHLYSTLDGRTALDVARVQHVNRIKTHNATLIVAVRDFPRIFTDEFASELKDSGAIDAVNHDGLKLILDHSNEGAGERELEVASALMKQLGIEDLQNISWLGANTLVHPQKTGRIRHCQYHYFLLAVYTKLHQQITSNRLNGKWIKRSFHSNQRQPYALCLNATPRLRRIISILELLHQRVFEWEEFLSYRVPNLPFLSFSGFGGSKLGGCDRETVRRELEAIGRADLLETLNKLEKLAPLKVDGFTEKGNMLFDRIDSSVYEHTIFSCVTETHWDSSQQLLMTEKLIKPLCLGHPVVIFGAGGLLSLARRLGFGTFEHVLDPTYDSISHYPDRIRAAARSARQAQLLSKESMMEWEDQVLPMMIANNRWAVNGFKNLLDNLYHRPLRLLINGSAALWGFQELTSES